MQKLGKRSAIYEDKSRGGDYNCRHMLAPERIYAKRQMNKKTIFVEK